MSFLQAPFHRTRGAVKRTREKGGRGMGMVRVLVFLDLGRMEGAAPREGRAPLRGVCGSRAG